jgi:cell division protein FtsL
MIKLSGLFWLIVVATAGFAMFAVKYEVQGLADHLARSVKQADDIERDIRALGAEWAYLNRPDALAQLNQRFLSLAPIATKQLRTSLADIPMRPAPPPPAPVETVAAMAPIAPAPTPPIESDAAARPPVLLAEAAAQPPSPRSPPPEQARPILTAALDTHLAAESGKPAPVKAAARPNPTHRAASLDQLIAQIAESR